MAYKKVLEKASNHLSSMKGHTMPVLEVAKPENLDYAQHLAKIISKLSPLVGNMIEYNVCIELNKLEWSNNGTWKRQDPGFPDTIFESELTPTPGIEIKTWFPLATEITARFKDTVKFFEQEQTNVALVVWLPEFIIYGKPKIIDVWVGTAKSLAISRDNHYHNPPDYLVFEPEDTSSRTSNLQQTNTNGYKFQGNKTEFEEAKKIVESWNEPKGIYNHSDEYQQKVKQLLGRFNYRLDTNFAKIDRIQHEGLEKFKKQVLETKIHNHTIKEWSKLINDENTNITDLLNDIL
ncbi:hypothetical protein [Flavobacterium covae]|uniref:hypothetical protein n=1 Tax=Flavobacterium covae TaxID=2906076 RepID=UPI0033993392